MLYTTTTPSPIGLLTLASDGHALTGLWVEGQKYFGRTLVGAVENNPSLSIFKETIEWLESYFAGGKPEISQLPLAPGGSDYRQNVWHILCQIPYGSVTTYGAIAREIARARGVTTISGQAVGGAVGHNPISIIIPCHRVVGSDGSLTGYASGVDTKLKLLTLEGVDTSIFHP